MNITNKKRLILLCSFILSVPLLNGCMEKYIPKEKTEEKPVEETDKVKTEEQQSLLDEQEVISPEEAVNNMKPNEGVEEIPNATFTPKSSFADITEFSQYISELFYKYHSKEMDSEQFLELLRPHLHSNFIEQMPSDSEAQIEMFKTLQELFSDSVNSNLTSFTVTSTTESNNHNEVVFYRKYSLENGGTIFYESTAMFENDKWLLMDDVPTVEYNVINSKGDK